MDHLQKAYAKLTSEELEAVFAEAVECAKIESMEAARETRQRVLDELENALCAQPSLWDGNDSLLPPAFFEAMAATREGK